MRHDVSGVFREHHQKAVDLMCNVVVLGNWTDVDEESLDVIQKHIKSYRHMMDLLNRELNALDECVQKRVDALALGEEP